MKRLRICATTLLALPFLASCGVVQEGIQEGINSADYTEALKANFMAGCQQEAEKARDAETSRKYCECTFERISATIPVEEYTKLDSGEQMSPDANARLNIAVTQCGGNASNL